VLGRRVGIEHHIIRSRHRRLSVRAALLASSTLMAAGLPMSAGAVDSTWQSTPTVAGPTAGTFNFNAAANWTPATVPTGTAFFGVSNGANLSFSSSTTIDGWTFNAGASAYTFTNTNFRNVQFNGTGVVINGGSATITNNSFGSSVTFNNTSTAGSASITNNSGTVQFNNTSTAGSATINNNNSSFVTFSSTSTAGSATINNNANNGSVRFFNRSTAGSATINNNAGTLFFADASTAGNATINNAGTVQFFDTSTAGSASINNAGTLFFGQTSTAGSAAIMIGPH
jgi:hypothetical protein